MTNRPLLLIVEDDAEIAELLEENLRAHGFDTVTAANGVELFSTLETRRPDLLLLDIMLPGEDGLTLCRRLRAGDGGVSETPIIFLSALGDLTDRVVGLELGADDYLPKPFEMRSCAESQSAARATSRAPTPPERFCVSVPGASTWERGTSSTNRT